MAALAATLILLASLPATAGADCGGVHRAKPSQKQKRNKGRAPLAIGDSVMLFALPYLAKNGFEADARGCRGFDEGLRVARRRKQRGTLPHLVVLALGADFSISRRQIRRALGVAGPKRIVGLVTPRETGGGSGRDAKNVRWAGRKYPHRVRVLDWVKRARGHRGWFQPDGLHLTFKGARNFARLFRKALPWADPKPPPKGSARV